MSNGDGRFSHQDGIDLMTYVDMRLCAMDKASDLAADNLRDKIHGLNEWRSQNKDERNQFMTRVEYESKHELLVKDIKSLEKLVYTGVGIALVVEILLRYLK